MKLESVLVALIYLVVMGVCAWAAFRTGAWVIGILAIVGALTAIAGALKLSGAWADPKPWDDGDGE